MWTRAISGSFRNIQDTLYSNSEEVTKVVLVHQLALNSNASPPPPRHISVPSARLIQGGCTLIKSAKCTFH